MCLDFKHVWKRGAKMCLESLISTLHSVVYLYTNRVTDTIFQKYVKGHFFK